MVLRNAGGLEFLLNLFDHLVVRAQLGRTNKGNADLTVKLLPDQLADPLRHLIVPKLLRAAVGKGNQEVVPSRRHGAVVKKPLTGTAIRRSSLTITSRYSPDSSSGA